MAFAWIWSVLIASDGMFKCGTKYCWFHQFITKPNWMAKHSQYCLGTAETQEKEKVSSEEVTWSEVCLAITILMLLCSVCRANTAANCQVVGRWRFSVRSSQNAGGVSRMHKQNFLRRNRETGRPHQRKRGGSMKISTPRENCQLLRMVRINRFISAPRLRM